MTLAEERERPPALCVDDLRAVVGLEEVVRDAEGAAGGLGILELLRRSTAFTLAESSLVENGLAI